MKTTLDLDDALLTQAKMRAAQQGTTLKALVEQALRAKLSPPIHGASKFHLELPVVCGVAPPAVDPADRDALYEFIEGRS